MWMLILLLNYGPGHPRVPMRFYMATKAECERMEKDAWDKFAGSRIQLVTTLCTEVTQ